MTRNADKTMLILNDEAPAGGRRFLYQVGDQPLEGLTIKRPLGWGGFGEVYFAVTDAGKELAMKHVTHSAEVERRGVEHCINIRHPNLIEIYDIRRTKDNSTFVLMEYADGQTLRSLLNELGGGLPVWQACQIARGMIRGVAGLHAYGIVHRDLKPANVFVSSEVVKIGDYGLSKLIGSMAMEHSTSVGTCHYMAPEIRTGRYEKPIDIYAVGAMLFEMLTGRPPFAGESQAEVLMRHQFDLPRLEELPPPFRGVVGSLLEKDPGRRPRELLEVIGWLDAAEAQFEADIKANADWEAARRKRGEKGTAERRGHEFWNQIQHWLRGDSRRRQNNDNRQTKGQPTRPLGRNHGWEPDGLEMAVWPDSRLRLRQTSKAAMIAIMICWLLATPVGFFSGVNMSEAPNRMAFVAVSGFMISSAMLALASVWDGWEVSAKRKRLTGLCTGSMLGVMVAVLGAWLGVDARPHLMSDALPGFFESARSAFNEGTVLHYAILIGLTLAIPRWWLLAARDRRSRWSISKVFMWWVWSIAFVPALGAITLEPQVGIGMAIVMLPGLVVSIVSPWDKRLGERRRKVA